MSCLFSFRDALLSYNLQQPLGTPFQMIRSSVFSWGPTLRSIQQRATAMFSFGATPPIWALAYLHETLRFTSVF
jgi:hypothetical protein